LPDSNDSQLDRLSSDDPSSAIARPKRRGRGKKRYKVFTVLVSTVVALALAVTLGAAYWLRHLDDNIDYQDYDAQLTNRPTKVAVDTGPQEPLNLLVMGSDTREGAGNDIDGLTGGGERSDTTILFHLSADRTFAYGISIPRDTLVDRPDCVGEDGETIPGAEGAQWNEAFAVGGPACTMQQFEQLTGIRLDNYVLLDFNGFKDMVDAIDGVEVCIPEPIVDRAHGIDMPAGTRKISGKEALNYVRARYTLGDGSDIGRIKRQQAFVAAMAAEVVSSDVLTRPDRVLGFLDAATSSLQTDFDSVRDIGKVGLSFQGIGLDKIKFVTVPWQYSPIDPNRVEWLPSADKLWQTVIDDQPLGRKLGKGSISAKDDVEGDGASQKAAAERESAGLCA
jgi:LCP family protein required for cell wall assembly